MAAGIPSTTFQPDPTCVAASNLWLRETSCTQYHTGHNYDDYPCTYTYHGQSPITTAAISLSPSAATENAKCFAPPPDSTAYTACPESYTPAGVSTKSNYWQSFYSLVTLCCPE